MQLPLTWMRSQSLQKGDDDVIDLKSEGYERIIVSLSSFDPAKAEKGTSQALIQGVASKLKEEGI